LSEALKVRLDVRTRNPLNGGTGHSRLAGIIASKERHKLRQRTSAQCRAAFIAKFFPRKVYWGEIAADEHCVRLTRIAPRRLDDDGWQAAAKPIRDGIADWLGVVDNDPRFTWHYAQRRGRPREYAVEIDIVRLQALSGSVVAHPPSMTAPAELGGE